MRSLGLLLLLVAFSTARLYKEPNQGVSIYGTKKDSLPITQENDEIIPTDGDTNEVSEDVSKFETNENSPLDQDNEDSLYEQRNDEFPKEEQNEEILNDKVNDEFAIEQEENLSNEKESNEISANNEESKHELNEKSLTGQNDDFPMEQSDQIRDRFRRILPLFIRLAQIRAQAAARAATARAAARARVPARPRVTPPRRSARLAAQKPPRRSARLARKPARPGTRKPSRSKKERKRKPHRPRCPTIKFPCSSMPNVCANIKQAFRMGKSRTLTRTTDHSQIRRNRRRSGCQDLDKKDGYNCDEYPFASSFQGGRGAVVRLVPIEENSMQGGLLAAFYVQHKIGHRGCFKVSV